MEILSVLLETVLGITTIPSNPKRKHFLTLNRICIKDQLLVLEFVNTRKKHKH